MSGESLSIEQSPEISQTDEISQTPAITESTDVSAPKIIKGIYDAEEFADELWEMRVDGLPGGVSTGWENLDEFYTVVVGQWTIVTGVPNYGKSTLLDNLLVNLARLHDWKILYFSFENQPIKLHIANLMEIYSGRQYGRPDGSGDRLDRYKMTDEEFAHAFTFVNEHFRFANPDEADCTIDGVIALSEEAKRTGFDFQALVTDPYNELEHRRLAAMSETEYISYFISKFRRFARRENFHWFCVAHPAKPEKVSNATGVRDSLENKIKTIYKKPTLYSISSSANWFNKADMGIIVHRDMEKNNSPTEIEIEKVRFKHCGKRGTAYLHYDFFCSRLVQTENELLYRKMSSE